MRAIRRARRYRWARGGVYWDTLRTDLITIDPEITGSTPVFTGMRVVIETLFDYLAAGEPLDEFLAGFPSVSREHAEGVLQLAHKLLVLEHLFVQPAQIDF